MFSFVLVDGNNRLMNHHKSDHVRGVSRVVGETKRIERRYGVRAIVCFDHPEASENRKEIYSGYKAGRKEDDTARQALRKCVLACREEFPIWFHEDYEADDLIASLCEQYPEPGMYIHSGDFDLFALLDAPNRLQITNTVSVSNDPPPTIYGTASAEAKVGVRIDQFDEYRALVGDSSDKLPGVPGIGKKTALDILSQFETVAQAVRAGPSLKIGKSKRNKLREGWDNGDFEIAMQLTKLRRDVPIPVEIQQFIYQNYEPIPAIDFDNL